MVNMSNHGDWATRTAPGVTQMVLFRLLGRSLGTPGWYTTRDRPDADDDPSDPEFENASPTLTLTPSAFNFDVPSTSPFARQNSGAEKRETIGGER
jgi:hypothetical protein